MTDSSRPSLPPPSDTDRSAASEHESVPTDASCPDPASATPTSIDAARENIPEPFREAVSALRKQTQTAAETIRALRAENQRLREKVEELSQRPDVRDNDAFAHFDDDRDALRERIQHFIDAIDDHLDSAPESGVASGKIERLRFTHRRTRLETHTQKPPAMTQERQTILLIRLLSITIRETTFSMLVQRWTRRRTRISRTKIFRPKTRTTRPIPWRMGCRPLLSLRLKCPVRSMGRPRKPVLPPLTTRPNRQASPLTSPTVQPVKSRF